MLNVIHLGDISFIQTIKTLQTTEINIQDKVFQFRNFTYRQK